MTRDLPAHFPCVCLFGFWVERSKKQQVRALPGLKIHNGIAVKSTGKRPVK